MLSSLRRGLRVIAPACLLWGLGTTADAVIITIDPGTFSPGADMSSPADGVTLQTMLAPGVLGSVRSAVDGEGERVFGSSTGETRFYAGNDAAYCFTRDPCSFVYGYQALLVTFDSPTDYVWAQGEMGMDQLRIHLYDSERRFLGDSFYNRVITPEGGGSERSTIQTWFGAESPLISYAIIAGEDAWSSIELVRFNQVESASVPEPGTWALLSAALAGVAIVHRRRKVGAVAGRA